MKDFIDQYVAVLKNYVGFEGRARRSEFWKFALVSFVIGIVLNMVSSGLNSLYSLAVLLPSLAVGARRLHDIGKSGWWQLLVLIPILGWIALLIFFVLDGEPKDNAYGKNPRGGAGASVPPQAPLPPTPEVPPTV